MFDYKNLRVGDIIRFTEMQYDGVRWHYYNGNDKNMMIISNIVLTDNQRLYLAGVFLVSNCKIVSITGTLGRIKVLSNVHDDSIIVEKVSNKIFVVEFNRCQFKLIKKTFRKPRTYINI